jgi:hypothetical protein
MPTVVPHSSATRCAKEVAATRRGCVHPTTRPPAVQPLSSRYWGSSDSENKQQRKLNRNNNRAREHTCRFTATSAADNDYNRIILQKIQEVRF